MRDRSDAILVAWRPPRQPAQRIVFEPLATGGFQRTTFVRDGPTWRPTGSEIVRTVIVEDGREVRR